jgi:outer membrane protein insertion porin family
MAVVLCAAAALSQDLSGRSIASVGFSGLERVSEQVAGAKLEAKEGGAYDANVIARDIRRLFELGFFTSIEVDVKPQGDKVALVYRVQEKRVVDTVKIIGNKKIKRRKLLGSLSMREGDPFFQEALVQERAAMMTLYNEKGFANTEIDVLAEPTGPSRVRLVYSVQEGKKARIRRISFTGEEALSRRKLKKLMKTHRAFWFFGGKYKEEKLEADLEHILEEYGNRGRLEADIPGTELDYTGNGKGVHLTIHLSEGPEYRVGALDVANNTVYDDDEMLSIIEVQAGDIHNKGQVAEDGATIQKGYRDSGYVRADAEPRVTLDRENKTTHVVHHMEEGDLKYIREIKITGNEISKDEVLRRELMIAPEDRYDGGAVKASKRRLENTRYFDDIRINLEDFDTDDRYTDLLVDVEEGKTGTFNFGAGFSTDDGLGGFSELRLNNFDVFNWPKFSGGGQQFNLKLNIGERRTEYSMGLTDPELFGYPIAGGFDLFNESYRVRGGANYREEQRGGQLRFGKSLSPYVTARVSLRYQNTNLSELPLSFLVNREIRLQRGESDTLSTRWQIERNTIDSYRDPGHGGRHLFSTDIAGFGGDHEFVKLEHDSIWYWALGKKEKWVLSLRMREGWMTEYGNSDYIPLQDRFYAGGSTTVRGYDTRDIGPYAREFGLFGSRFAVGGSTRLLTNIEMKYRASEMLKVYFFADSGGVWGGGDRTTGDGIKHSVGIGLGMDVPAMGPIRVDYGFPINPEDWQGSGRMHLSTGIRF